MKDNMDNGNNELARERKTWKRGIPSILTWVPEKTLALATYFATRHWVWGYTAPVTVPACIAGLLAARLLGAASVPRLAVPMFAVILAETLVESRRRRGEWGAAGMRTVIVSTGFLVLARLLFLDQPTVYLLIMRTASIVIAASTLIWWFGEVVAECISLLRELLSSDSRTDERIPWGVLLTFDAPALLVTFFALPSLSGFWSVLAAAAVLLVFYFLVFLRDPWEEEDLAWLKSKGYRVASAPKPIGKAVLVKTVNDSTKQEKD